MSTDGIIQVDYRVYGSLWHIRKALQKLKERKVLSFDVETSGVYPKKERAQALKLLENESIDIYVRKLASVAARNSGLSYPSLVNVTHFIFGLREDFAVVFVIQDPRHEKLIWDWIAEYEGLLVIHNTLFDLKLMYHRVGKLPKHYEDTALMAKSLINDAETWRSKVGLKELMGACYSPAWSLFNQYEPEDLFDTAFLEYAAIDGAATYKLAGELEIAFSQKPGA